MGKSLFVDLFNEYHLDFINIIIADCNNSDVGHMQAQDSFYESFFSSVGIIIKRISMEKRHYKYKKIETCNYKSTSNNIGSNVTT